MNERETPDELEAMAFELEAEACMLRARATRLRAATHSVHGASAHTDAPRLLTKLELANALGVSPMTVHRLNPPHVAVGASSTRRYDLAHVREWLARRTPAPTTPNKASVPHNRPVSSRLDEDDVSDETLARAGLRRVKK